METTLTKEFVEGADAAGGACDVLISEQRRIMDYFRQFEDAENDRKKKAGGDACMRAIEVVIALEEELFYPAVRRSLGERQRVVQALAANQVAKLLIKELKTMAAGERYNGRFELLKDNLTQHFANEDAEIFPRVGKAFMDSDDLAGEMRRFRTRLNLTHEKRTGVRRIAGAAAWIAAIGAAIWFVRGASSKRPVEG